MYNSQGYSKRIQFRVDPYHQKINTPKTLQYEVQKALRKISFNIEEAPPLFRQEIWKERKGQIAILKSALSNKSPDSDLVRLIKYQVLNGRRAFLSSYNQYLDDLSKILKGIHSREISTDARDFYNDKLNERKRKSEFVNNNPLLELEKQKIALQDQYKDLQDSINIRRQQIETLKQELKDVSSRNSEDKKYYYVQQSGFYRDKIAELRSQKNNLEFKIGKFKKKHKSLQNEYLEMMQEYSSYLDNINSDDSTQYNY